MLQLPDSICLAHLLSPSPFSCVSLPRPSFLLYLSLSQIDSSELIRSRERVARSLSTLRASLPPNTVYIYQPLQSQTTVQQDPTLPSCTLGMFKGEVREFYCICEKCCMKSFVAPERCDVRKKWAFRTPVAHSSNLLEATLAAASLKHQNLWPNSQ